MAEDIVSSLFGLSPRDEYLQQKDKEFQAYSTQLQGMGTNPKEKLGLMIGAQLGRGLGQGIGNLLGIQDPQLKRISGLEGVLQETQQELGPEMSDPTKLYPALYDKLNSRGFSREAAQVALKGNEAINAFKQQQAQQGKLQAEANKLNLQTQQDAMAQQAAQEVWAKAQQEGRTPTNEEIIGAVSPFVSADKLAPMMQSASDKAAYRQSMIDQARLAAEARLEAAKERGATQLEIAKMNAESRQQIAQLNAAVRAQTGANKGLSGREARYADNVAIAGNEVIGGVGNLVNMPFTSSTGVFGSGVGQATSSESLWGAPIAVLKNSVTSDNIQRYNTEISNIGKYFATLNTGGLAATAGAQKQFESQFSIKEGDTELTRLTKLAQMRQTFERVADIKLKSKATPDEQKDDWNQWLKQIKESVPITVNDVNKIANSKNPQQTMADAMGKAKQQVAIPAGAIEKLKATPSLAADFDKKFGAGMAAKYLGNK